MRVTLELDLEPLPGQTTEQWIANQIARIQDAAHDDAAIASAEAFNGIDHSTYTILETFDPATVTLPQLARAFATFLQYLQNHGPRRE